MLIPMEVIVSNIQGSTDNVSQRAYFEIFVWYTLHYIVIVATLRCFVPTQVPVFTYKVRGYCVDSDGFLPIKPIHIPLKPNSSLFC